MQKTTAFLLIFAITILIGCEVEMPAQITQNQTESQVVNVTQQDLTPTCEGITCAENEECMAGKCYCKRDYKQCAGTCIPSSKCCDDEECKSNEKCIQGKCEQTVFCNFHELWSSEKIKCECEPGTKWCIDLEKCIPNDYCCNIADCNPLGGKDRMCVPTQLTANVCLEIESQKHCRIIQEGERASMSVAGNDYDFYLQKIYAQGELDLKIVQRTKEYYVAKLAKNSKTQIEPNIYVSYTVPGLYGGNCKTS